MSVIYTLVLAQQQVKLVSDDYKTRAVVALFFGAGLLMILLYMFFNRPKVDARLKKIEQDPGRLTKRLWKFFDDHFEWLPGIIGHNRTTKHQADS